MRPDVTVDIDRTVALTDDYGHEIAEIDVVCEVGVMRGRHRDDDTASLALEDVYVYVIGQARPGQRPLPAWLAEQLWPWFEANREEIEAEALGEFRIWAGRSDERIGPSKPRDAERELDAIRSAIPARYLHPTKLQAPLSTLDAVRRMVAQLEERK